MGFPWADSADGGVCSLTVTDNDLKKAEEKALWAAEFFWRRREEFLFYNETKVPEEAAGTITLNTAFSFVSPSARAPSNKLLSKALSELSETVIIVGRIIKDRRTDAVMMLFPLPNMDLKSGTRTINPKKP